MMRRKQTTLLTLMLTAPLVLSSCGNLNLPQPPLDDMAREEQSAMEQERLNQRAQEQQYREANAKQAGLVDGGPSDVSAEDRLKFIMSKDITIHYKSITWKQINDETSEYTIPANSRTYQVGTVTPLEDVPTLYSEGQMLPKAFLNDNEITILNVKMKSNNLVLTILGKENVLSDTNVQGTLLMKAPSSLKNMCEEGPRVDCSDQNLFARDWTGLTLNGMIAQNANATNLNAPRAILTDCNFQGAQLFRANFLGGNVDGCNFRAIKGQNVMFNSDNTTKETMTSAVRADFTGSYLYRCEFDQTDLHESIFDRADAQNCTFDKANMKGVRAAGAWFHRIKASEANLEGMIAPGVRFSQGTFTDAKFANANLSGAFMDRVEAANADFTSVVLTGQECTMAQAYLDNAILVNMQASNCTFPRASMKRVNAEGFQGANTDLTYTDLKGANFTNANLAGANLFAADTKGVIMDGANLIGAVCPNGDIIGQTAYGRYANRVVTDCSWNDKNYSISGTRLFETRSLPAGRLRVQEKDIDTNRYDPTRAYVSPKSAKPTLSYEK